MNARGSPPLSRRSSRTVRKKIAGRRGPRRGGEIEAGVADLGRAVKKYRETEGTVGVEGIGIVIDNQPQVGE
jgi:hypothetical protein